MRKEDKESNVMSRRDFMRFCAASIAVFGLEFSDTFHSVRKAVADSAVDFRCSPGVEDSPLETYLKEIEAERAVLEVIVANHDVFGGFKGFTAEQRIEDFNRYFPLYKAAEIQYGIPWFLMWIIHAQETTVSREKHPDGISLKGTMQRDTRSYSDEDVKKAAEGWEFLHALPQEYSKQNKKPYFDSDEILWAASKIRRDAETLLKEFPYLSFEERFLKAQESYCKEPFAEARIRAYWKIKRFFKNPPRLQKA